MAINMDALLRIRADVQGENNIRRLGNSLQGLEGQAKNAGRSLATLRDGFRGLNGILAGIGAGLAIGKIFGDTATLESQSRSLEVLTGNAKQAAQIVKELQQFANVTPFESTELIETAKRLNAFGVEGSRVVEVTKRLGDVAGATGANVGELATAYGQVVAKGRLQGEELLQFQERGVALQEELQKMYGLSGQELQKALSSGRISSEAVEVAIKRLTDAGGKYANGAIAQSDTLKGKLSTLQDAFTNLAINIGKALTPIFKWLLDRTTELINRLNSGIGGLNAERNANAAAARATQQKFGLIGSIRAFNPAAEQYYQAQRAQFLKQGQTANPPATKPPKTSIVPPFLTPSSGAGSGSGGGSNSANERESRLSEILAANGLYRAQETIKARIAKAEFDQNTAEKLRLEYIDRGVQYLAEAAAIQQEKIPQDEKEAKLQGIKDKFIASQNQYQRELVTFQRQAIESLPSYLSGLESLAAGFSKTLDFSKQLTAEQERQKQLADGIAQTVGGGLASAFDALIAGTEGFGQSLRKIASGVLIDIAKQLLQIYVINTAISAISGLFGPKSGGFLPNVKFNASAFSLPSLVNANGNVFAANGIVPYAMGGIVDRPTLFPFAKGIGLMGEAGPEAIIPLQRGANGKLGVAGGGGSTSVVVNVDAKGTSVQGDANRGQQLGRVVSQAVQAELIKQKRPGGLLA